MSRTTVLRSQVIDAARHPTRVVLMGSAIIIAAFVVFGTVLAASITERTSLDSFSGTPEAVDFVITDASAKTLEAVRALPGVAEAVVRTEAFLPFADEADQGLVVISDPGTGPLTTVQVLAGRYPSADHEIAVTQRTLDRRGLQLGATVRVASYSADPSTPAEAVRLTVVGVAVGSGDFGNTAFTTEEALRRFVPVDRLHRIDVRASVAADALADPLARAVAGTSPAGAEGAPVIRSGAEVRLEEATAVSERVRGLFAAIGMFVAIAVVAAVLVATSTFRIVFAQRMRQLALLRAVGAQRRTLLGALVAEGALTGLLAAVAGVLGAWTLANVLPPLLGRFGVTIAAPGFPAGWAAGVVLGAVAITALAVLAPATTASRVAPLEALRAAATNPGQRGINAGRVIVGALLGVGAALAFIAVVTQLPGPESTAYDPATMLLLVVASGAMAFLALVALGPVLVRPILAFAGAPLRRLGPVGRLAVGGVGGAPRRAAAVSVVVALGVTMVGGALVGTASLRELINRELAGMAPADLQVIAREGVDTPLPAGFVQQVSGAQEFRNVVAYRAADDVRLAGLEEGVVAADVPLLQLSTLDDFVAATGNLALEPGSAVALTWFAQEAGLVPGDTMRVSLGDRSIELRLTGTLDNTPVGAGLLLDPSDLDRLGVGPAPTALLADVADGAALDREAARTAAVQALSALTGPGHTVVVLADARDDLNADLNQVIAVMLSLLGLTIVVAVVGVGTTTALSAVERIREVGLLRAVGLSRLRLRTMMTLEAGLYGLIGAVLGLALAIPYAWLAVQALGVNAPVEFPAGQLLLVVAVLSVATALAGVWPARRAARVSPVTALGADA